MPPVRMRGDGRKAKNPKKTLLRLLSYMKPYLPTLGVVLLCGVAEGFYAAADQPSVPQFIPVAGALAITLLAAGDLKQMMGLGVETMEELDVFAKALLPTLSAAVAALVIWCHRGNIRRLLTGTEKKFQWHVDPLDGGGK